MEKRLFTSESVTEGHPDKICDAVSDAVLDALMEQDPFSRVACETCTNTGFVLVMGEITTKANIDIPAIVRKTVTEIGYDSSEKGFDGNTCAVMVSLDKQSTDIAMGVDKALEAKESHMTDEQLDAIGAGDQGMMFGYATDETPEYMPYPISLAHKLTRQLTKVRKDGTLSYLRPDGKSQVSVEYDENGKPFRLEAVVLSTQHDEHVSQEQIHEDIKKYVFDPVLPADMIDADTKFFINPTGRFVIGGPNGDSGLTGRDDELSLTEAQFSSVWSPVAINKLAHYKSLKRKCTDEEFAQAYQEALKVVTPLALMSREDQLYGIASALRAVVDDGSMAYSMEANHYNDPYGYFVLRTASCAGCARATALCLDILGIPYEHVNENQYSHQWCRVPMEDGGYWICDAFGLYCGPEPEPYQHPYF